MPRFHAIHKLTTERPSSPPKDALIVGALADVKDAWLPRHGHNYISWGFALTLALLSLLTLLWMGQPAAATVVALPASPTSHIQNTTAYTTYLPLIAYIPPPGIYGRVFDQGDPAPGIPLALHYFDEAAYGYGIYAQTTTDTQGRYRFSGLPSNNPALPNLSFYWVSFNNAGNPDHLDYQSQNAVRGYVQGANVPGGDFEIADVARAAHAETVTLPFTFHWTPRPAVPGESYSLNLYELCEQPPCRQFTAWDLGYVDSYTLDELPYTFEYHAVYYWKLLIEAQGTFASSGSTPIRFAPAPAVTHFLAPITPRRNR